MLLPRRASWLLRIALLALMAMVALADKAGARALDCMQMLVAPGVATDAVWMADPHSAFWSFRRDAQIRALPLKALAFMASHASTAEASGLQDQQNGGVHLAIVPTARDTRSYFAFVHKGTAKPQDAIGKTVATRIGSTVSRFTFDDLHSHAVAEDAIAVRNLDPPHISVALCCGDIAGFHPLRETLTWREDVDP